ncbi:MAG TPA: hypothetical protein VGV35_08175, partial [Bryobacteraceae bacterium]|nr:hypothetical protein [Bryobacteraceae bacterium]
HNSISSRLSVHQNLGFHGQVLYVALLFEARRQRYNESLAKILPLLIFPWVLYAQDRPQFVWQGEVDGTNILYLHGKRLEVKIQEGAPVVRQQFQFYDPLPEIRQDARLEVREGRGFVHIVDQPRVENSYTLAVSVEDRQPGSSFYSLAIFWDASNRSFEGRSRVDQVTWSGRVDAEAIISCQRKLCVSSAVTGAAAANEHFKFSKPLPHRDVEVRLEHSLGRGDIRLMEQPREQNNYTARVAIRDPQDGSGEYSFTLTWGRGIGPAPAPPDATRGLIWTGSVDGRVRVTIQGGSAYTVAVEGQPAAGGHADFLRPLPSRSDLHPAIKKLRGRGQVEIVEMPSAANHFRLTFEIRNAEGGADSYEVEVDW